MDLAIMICASDCLQ